MTDPDDDNASPDGLTTEQSAALLRDAREKSSKLLERLLLEQAQVEQNPPDLAPEVLAQGRAAMSSAVEAARRTLEAIQAAIATSHEPEDPVDASAENQSDEDRRRWN